MENLEEFKRLAKQHNTEILLLGDDYTDCDWFFYEEDGACGHPLFISSPKMHKIIPSENIYAAIGESVYGLAEAIISEDVNKLWFHCEELLYSFSDDLFNELEE